VSDGGGPCQDGRHDPCAKAWQAQTHQGGVHWQNSRSAAKKTLVAVGFFCDRWEILVRIEKPVLVTMEGACGGCGGCGW